MLPVESMLNILVSGIKDIQNPVSIVLASCGKDHYFKEWSESLQECDTVWSDLEFALSRFKVNKSFIKIKDKSVLKLGV